MANTGERPGLWQRLGRALPEPVVRVFKKHIRPYLPDVSFITLHYLYFIATCMLASVIFWASSTPSQSVSYTDSLFLAVSAMTEAGLNTVNLSTLNTWQQIMLFVLIMMGSSIFVSSAILHIRKRAFETKLEDLVERRRKKVRLSRSFTFSRSRRRESISSREGAIASGAVRGRAIKDDPDSTLPDPALDQEDQRNGHVSNGRVEADTNAADDENATVDSPERDGGHIRFDSAVQPSRDDFGHTDGLHRTRSRIFTGSGVGVRRMDNHPRHAPPPYLVDEDEFNKNEKSPPDRGSTAKIDRWIEEKGGFIGRNSQFHNLSEKDRKRLGGIEYDAVCLLSWVVPVYFVMWQMLGAIGVGAWMQLNIPDTAYENGLNPFWAGAFFAISAFNNSGMALIDANAVALQRSYYSLLTLSLLILAGNTCFPPFLRLILWTMKKGIPKSAQSPEWQKRRRTLDFILTHPRRVYTNLFPAAQTWWLVGSLVLLNGIDWIAFEVLNIGNPTTETIPAHFRVLDGLFQAFAVRSGGFYVVSIAGLYPGLLVLYVLMMYVSAMPVTMTIRNTNVYEERSLGIFAEDEPEKAQPGDSETQLVRRRESGVIGTLKHALSSKPGHLHHAGTYNSAQKPMSKWSRQDFIRQQLRGQLGHDLWWLALAVLFIAIIETGQELRDPVVFSVFNIIFEVVSGYGCVGISTGVPWNAYSFSGAWHILSKLILCAVMLRGRHRGLPVAIDKAVLLPDETLAWAEEEDAERRRERGRSREPVSAGAGLGGMGFKRVATGFSSSVGVGTEEMEGRRREVDGEDTEKDASKMV